MAGQRGRRRGEVRDDAEERFERRQRVAARKGVCAGCWRRGRAKKRDPDGGGQPGRSREGLGGVSRGRDALWDPRRGRSGGREEGSTSEVAGRWGERGARAGTTAPRGAGETGAGRAPLCLFGFRAAHGTGPPEAGGGRQGQHALLPALAILLGSCAGWGDKRPHRPAGHAPDGKRGSRPGSPRARATQRQARPASEGGRRGGGVLQTPIVRRDS